MRKVVQNIKSNKSLFSNVGNKILAIFTLLILLVTIFLSTFSFFKSKNGFLDLFTGDNSYAKQWRYTIAPDADARAIQATYWADIWAKEQGENVDEEVSKSSKMGDYLRYSMFDKYFKNKEGINVEKKK